jgi:5-methylcytosine-specific restriction enzyme A
MCPAMLDSGTRFCVNHAFQRRVPDERESAARRGYDYRWQKFRLHYLAKNPLCVDCKCVHRYKEATDIHHVVKLRDNPGLKYDDKNLMPLCHECHAARTAKGE